MTPRISMSWMTCRNENPKESYWCEYSTRAGKGKTDVRRPQPMRFHIQTGIKKRRPFRRRHIIYLITQCNDTV